MECNRVLALVFYRRKERKRRPLLIAFVKYSGPIKKILIILLLPLLLVNVNLIMVHVVTVKLVILTLHFYFFVSFIVKSSDGKIHAYILRAVELAEGTMATHTVKMPIDNVKKVTAKLELLEPQIN